MKKVITLIVAAALMLSAFALCVGAEGTSKWVISKDATVVLPAELTKGYSEMNSDTIDVSLSGFNYLHVTVTFATDLHVEWPGSWGYMIMVDNLAAVGAYETSTNVVSYNILAATADYKANTPVEFVIPLAEFGAYGAGSVAPTEWTNSLKMIRFVFAGGGINGNPEITFSNIYLSVNDNDPAPASPKTGSNFVAVSAVAAIAVTATAVVLKKKKH